MKPKDFQAIRTKLVLLLTLMLMQIVTSQPPNLNTHATGVFKRNLNFRPDALIEMMRWRDSPVSNTSDNVQRDNFDKNDQVILGAHRGLWMESQCTEGFFATENSWGAVWHAWDHGYEMVELDISALSADGVGVLSHDINVGRVVNTPNFWENSLSSNNKYGYPDKPGIKKGFKFIKESNFRQSIFSSITGLDKLLLKPSTTDASKAHKNLSRGEKMTTLREILEKMYANNIRMVIELDLKSMAILKDSWKVVQDLSHIYANHQNGPAWDWVIFKLPNNRLKMPDGENSAKYLDNHANKKYDIAHFEREILSVSRGWRNLTPIGVLNNKFKYVPVAYSQDQAVVGNMMEQYRLMYDKPYVLYFEINVKKYSSATKNTRDLQYKLLEIGSLKRGIGAYHVVFDEKRVNPNVGGQYQYAQWNADGIDKNWNTIDFDDRNDFFKLVSLDKPTDDGLYAPQASIIITDLVMDARNFLTNNKHINNIIRDDGNGNKFRIPRSGIARYEPKEYMVYPNGCYLPDGYRWHHFDRCENPNPGGESGGHGLRAQLSDFGSLPTTTDLISIYPNPGKDEVTLQFSAAENSEGRLVVTSLSGSVVLERKIAIGTGENQIPISVNTLPPGLYMCSVIYGNVKVDTKLVVEK